MSDSLVSFACLLATIASYHAAKQIHRACPRAWLSPILTAPLVLTLLALIAGISYPTYFRDTRWLVWLLGPATIAFALPIYRQRSLIKRYPLSLVAGVVCGVVMGVASSACLAHWLSLSPDVAHSMLARSVSTPFALAATVAFKGTSDLTVLFVMITGITGMLVGEFILACLGVRSSIARGVSLGASAHGVGTVKARQMGLEEGAVASLTMVFAGVALVLLSPMIARLLG